MPFTLAHPAAVLPFAREPFVPAALVAGALAPDLPYVLRATGIPVTAQSWYEPLVNATTSHTVAGAVTVGLPLAASLYLAHLLARPPALALLARRPAPAGRRGRTARWAWVVVSLALGLATHLLWDSVTHADGFVVVRVPALTAPVAGDLTWARLLQHVSTAVGLLVLAGYGWRRRSAVLGLGPPARRRVLVAVGAVLGAGVVGAVLVARRWWGAGDGLGGGAVLEGVLSDAAKGAMAGTVVVTAAAVLVWWAHRLVGGRPPSDATVADDRAREES